MKIIKKQQPKSNISDFVFGSFAIMYQIDTLRPLLSQSFTRKSGLREFAEILFFCNHNACTQTKNKSHNESMDLIYN